jgi:hypothetical protein
MDMSSQLKTAPCMPGKSTRYPLGRKPDGTHSRYGRFVVERHLLSILGIELRFLIRPACSLVTIPTELSQLVWNSYLCTFILIPLGFSLFYIQVFPQHFVRKPTFYTRKAHFNFYQKKIMLLPLIFNGQSRWPCDLRRRSEATWLLGWQVRIPLRA